MHLLACRALFDAQVGHLPEELLLVRNWKILERCFPVLEVEFRKDGRNPLRLRFNCIDWNDQPPSVALLDSAGQALKVVPTVSPGAQAIFNQGPHPITRQPFICMAGVLEYHTHSSHLTDSWDNYKKRSAYELGEIVTQIWNGWLRTIS